MKLISQAVLILAMLAIVVAGAFLLLRDSPSAGGFEIVLPTAVPPQAEDVLKVYVSGAV